MNTKILRKLIYGFAFVAITAIAAVNLNMNANKYGLSDTQLANIEALARDEGVVFPYPCYYYMGIGAATLRDCSDCKSYPFQSVGTSGGCNP